MNKMLNIFSAFLVASSLLTVLITAHVSGYEVLLTSMTEEGKFFEWMSVVILFMIFVYGIVFCWKNNHRLSRLMIVLICGFSSIAFLGAMEEISWGQHLFNFDSPEYFAMYNYQGEFNLHNLVSPGQLDAIVYTFVYVIFIFIPLFVILLAPRIEPLGLLKPWVATPIMALMSLYGSSFQAYFYDNFLAWNDMVLLLGGVVLFGINAALKKMSLGIVVLYFLVCLCIALFMNAYEVFGEFNMQYEIREVFVVLAVLYYFIFLTQKVISEKGIE